MISTRTLFGLLALCSAVFFLPSLHAQSAYLEEDGLVVIEMENVAELNGWQITNTIAGATGTGYINWTGNQFFNQTGNGELRYFVNISTPGTYRFEWRVAVGLGDDGTEHNDSWLKVNADNFYGQQGASSLVKPRPACNNDPDYGCPEGSSTNGFFKIYGGGVDEFRWQARTNDNSAHQIYATFDAPGIYEIEVNARSSFHGIDRLVMYHSDVNSNTARDLTNPESALENVVTGIADVSGELRTWHDIELTFDGPETSETATANPFTDYRFDVTFTNGDRTYVVPGYYAADGNAAETSATSGNKWRVHFAPDTAGTWSWSADFKTGTDISVADDNTGGTSAGFMDGETGTFTVSPTDKTGRDNRGKGRLEYVGEHFLRYAQTGEWFVKAGADAPENTLAYEDFDEVPNEGNRRKNWQPHQQDYVAAEAEAYTWQNGKGSELLGVVNYLSTKGVNAFSFLTFNVQGDDKNVFPHIVQPDSTYGGNGGWADLHHDRFDVSRMGQWERIFSYADLKGMYLHFKLQETENDQLMDGGDVGREHKLYYRELIARFGHHLALNWNFGEENTQTTQQRKDMAAYMADTDPYGHLRVLHTYPGQKNQVYTPLLGSASEYTGLSLQTSDRQQTQNFGDTETWVENSANAGKKWVVAVDEPGNASIGVDSDPDDRKLTRQNVVWANFMAGGAGTEFYYGYQSGCGDLLCQDHRSRDEKYTDAALALNFFQTHFQQYLPNVTNADNLTTNNDDWVLNANDQAYAVYLPDGGSTGITLPMDGGVDWQVRWYNPRSGAISGATNITNAITAPDTEDWVALIEVGDCTEGAACDDGDDCTTNDVLDAACNCAGTFADADFDTVCDAEDQCPGENDLADADNDDIPDACDDCDNTTTGMACDDGNPTTINDAIDGNCNCTGQPLPGQNDYWFESECAAYGDEWEEVADASAVNGLYLRPVGTGNFIGGAPDDDAYYVSFDVTITTPGAYKIFALVRTTNDDDDSFWVRANGGNDWVQWNKIGFDYGYNGYTWAEMGEWTSGDSTTPETFDLVAGDNVIDFAVREPGIRFDRIYVTLDGDLPTGDGAAAFNCDDGVGMESCGAAGQPPFQILHFTKTSGFNHGTKSASLQMFEEIGAARNFTVVNSDNESAFDDLTTLMNYEVIVFANTSGNIPFTAIQQANLESYVASGGGVLGIHAATDMYRDASYTFYTNLMGGSRRNSPAHTGNMHPGTMNKVGSHPSTANVPDPWDKPEEYYYWPDTGLVDDIVVVLEVESTGSNSYDAARPASWYQTFDSGARSFYTTLGHFSSNYTDPDNDFRQHLADALCWLVEAETSSLPLNVIGAGLENDEGLHLIDWRVNGELPVLVELYGGYDQAAASLLKTDQSNDFGGVLNHRPNNETDWFYYRLRFVSEDGLATWSEWLVAAPFKEDAGGGAQVQYGAEGAVLVVPANGPAQAIISDSGGRTIGGLELTEGQNLLPKGPAGVYIIRFPFRAEALRYIVR